MTDFLKPLPGWVEDWIECYINIKINPNARIDFQKWLLKKGYDIPKTEEECEARLKEFSKNRKGRRKFNDEDSNGTIPIIDMDDIKNDTVRRILKY